MKKFTIFMMLFWIGCTAEPHKYDVERVVQHFLELRLYSAGDPDLEPYNDYELFQISCKNLRVKCNKILILLKKEKPDFYKTLMESKSL